MLGLVIMGMLSAEPVERPNAVGISADLTLRSQRDENFNNTRYSGPLGHFGLHYDRIGAHDRHALSLGGGAGVGRNRYDRSLLWIDLALRYTYQHVVVGDQVRLWLGGSAGGGPRLFQFRDEDADHVNWATGYDLALRAVVDWRARDAKGRQHGIEASIELPALGLVSRPPAHVEYNNDKPNFGFLMARAHTDPRLSSWHNVQSLRARAWWSVRLSPLAQQRVGYATEYTRTGFPEPVVAWSHMLAYRIDFRFGKGRRP